MFGSFLTFLSLDYSYGSLENMGPGFFPRWLGIIIFLSGCFLFLKNFLVETKVEISMREPLTVISSMMLIPIGYNYIGMIVLSISLIFLSTSCIKNFPLKEKFVLISIATVTLILIKLFFLPNLKL